MAFDCLYMGCKALGWAVYLSVDCPRPWWTGYFMENPTFIRASLSDIKVIMAIMHVLVEELLF
jgi:hypothetical protein